jgi:hypothetical protein
MQTTSYQIVGLRHNAWQGNGLAQRMREAEGMRVVLMREEMNGWDQDATAAYIDTEMVGYVADGKCRESSAYCDMAEGQLLEGYVTAVDCENHQLTVTVAVSGELPDLHDETALYEQWEHSYNMPPLMVRTPDEQRLLLLRRDVLRLLRAGASLDDTLRRDLEVYEQLMPQDISREATDDRLQIVDLMLHHADDDVRRWGRRMEVAVTSLGSPEARDRLADYLFRQLPQSDAFHQMVLRHSTIDVAALEQQLRLFPHRLYDEYCLSAADFASKLYYRRIPFRALRCFLSGLLLLEHLRGRTPGADSLSRRQQLAVADATEYVGRIAHCVSPDWQERIGRLWQQLTTDYAERIADVQRVRQATFNHRFVCRLVGTLLQQGVYRSDVTQTEYTRLLEGNSRSNLRKEVNQGVDDESTRLYLRQLLRQLNG